MHRLAEHLHLQDSNAPFIDYRIARTRQELEKAYSLVHREYLKRAYIKQENTACLRFSIYNALPETATIIGITNQENIVATATLIADSPLGLPMEVICRDELSLLRQQGKRLCEISMLACDSEIMPHASLSLPLKKLFPLLAFFKTIQDYTTDILQADCMCITINPKYKITFNSLLFQDIRTIQNYPEVNPVRKPRHKWRGFLTG